MKPEFFDNNGRPITRSGSYCHEESPKARWSDKKIEWKPENLGSFKEGRRWLLTVDGVHVGRIVKYESIGWHYGCGETVKAPQNTIHSAALALLESQE